MGVYYALSSHSNSLVIYRYLQVETEETPAQSEKSNEIFAVMKQRFIYSLKKYNPIYYSRITAQQNFMEKLLQLIHMVQTARVDRKKKVSLFLKTMCD